MTAGFLADACAVIAFHGDQPSNMTTVGLQTIRGGGVAVSAITVWEITRKVAIGKLAVLNGQTEAGCAAFLRERGYCLLPVSPEAAERANTFAQS